jgi:trk system potassium uptake protein TrkA
MKYIIIGLGNFGSSLAMKLTQQGNEVIGVDNSMTRVESLKDRISYTICMDATDAYTMTGLPIKESDIVIVAIGEDQGANIMATAILKNQNVKRLISRAINPMHENVLRAMGITEIVNPEVETAERWAKKLCLRGVVDSFELNGEYSIVEARVPPSFFGKSLEEIGFRRNMNLVVLTTIRYEEKEISAGFINKVTNVQGVASPQTVLQEGDIMVIYGSNKDIQKLLKTN